MKKTFVHAAVFGIAVLLGSCISFKIEPPPPPENQVEDMVLCKRIEEREALLFPEEAQAEFSAESGPVHCFVKLTNVSRLIRLKWKWFTPEGSVFRETDDVIVNREEVYLESVTAYDSIAPEGPGSYEGLWSVVIFVDGTLAGRRTFVLKR
jgi:hypothetical protein